MKRIVKLTESDLTRIVRRVIKENKTISEMEELNSTTQLAKNNIEKFMMEIAGESPEKQMEAIQEMMFQLKIYAKNLEYLKNKSSFSFDF